MAKTAKPGLWLVDASSYIFRAFHAVPLLTSKSGLPTNAVYGVTNMLLKLVREEDPERIVLVFDARGPTFRDELFSEYKAHRDPMPDDLALQIPWIRQAVDVLRLPVLEVPGVEADDVIATLVTRFAATAGDIVIITGDKDLMQLVGPGVTLWDSMRDRKVGPAEVQAKFGVPPAQVIEVLALMGDAVDNIPGVSGVGGKTAQALVQAFGSVEAIYQRLDDVESLPGLRAAKRVRAALERDREQALLSRELVELRRDVPLDVTLDDFRPRPPDGPRLRTLFTELGFQSLVAEFAPAETPRSGTTGWVVGRAGLDALTLAVSRAPEIALEIVGGAGTGRVSSVVVALDGTEACVVRLEPATSLVLGDLVPLLAGEKPVKVGGDLKAARVAIAYAGIELGALGFDLGVASYVLDPSRSSHRIEDLAADVLGERAPGANEDSPDALAELAAERARAALRLRPVLEERIDARGLGALFREVEMPLVRVLARMETRGVRVDVPRLRALSVELEGRLGVLLAEIYGLAGMEFNVSSPPQLRDVLFGKLGISTKGVRRGKTGLSTDVDVLTRLAREHPLPAKILDWRALSKLKSTYVDALPAHVDPLTSRLHTSFDQTVAATGRLSSSEPNLQNIPVRTEEGRRIRAAFLPAPGARLVSADYSQIELRVLAHVSGDRVLVESFRQGEDIHRRTAAEIFRVAPESVTADQRRAAKVINFGVLYGMGPQRLARELEIPQGEAEHYIKSYFERHPGVSAYVERAIDEARRTGSASTLLGRRRPIPDISNPEGGVRQFAERTAVNTPIQGTAADLIKVAMVRIDRRLDEERMSAGMILQVHDELIVEAPEAEVERAAAILRHEMEHAMELSVPLEVALGVGESWAELH